MSELFMDIRELRLGNIIRHNIKDDDGKFCEPNEAPIDEDDMFHFIAGVGIRNEEYVPLTEEWLVKFGFEKANDSFGGFLREIGEGEKIRIKEDSELGYIWPLNGYHHPKTKFVHQLQNLYFALTGEEL